MTNQMSMNKTQFRISQIRKEQGKPITEEDKKKMSDYMQEIFSAEKEGREPVLPEGVSYHFSKAKDF